MTDKKDAPERVKEPTQAERIDALEKLTHGLQAKLNKQAKAIDALNEVNDLRLRSRGLID